MNLGEYRRILGLEPISPAVASVSEGLLQPPDKSKLSPSAQTLVMDGKQPFKFVADVLTNEIMVAVETLLGVKDIKGLSDTMREKAKDIAQAYLETVQYPKNEGGDLPEEPAPAQASAEAPSAPEPEPGGETAQPEPAEGEIQ